MNIAVSFSGGRTSAYMAWRMLRDPNWNQHKMIFNFANTGKEREETLQFVDRCDKEFGLNVNWLEPVVNPEMGKGTTFKLVTFETAARNGEPFETVIKKYGIPNQSFQSCTRELKERPLTAFARSVFGKDFVTAIGIRIDEAGRIKRDPAFVFPLVEWFTTVSDVRKFWNDQSFDLELKDYEGNCDLCWKKSHRKKLTLIKENPRMADWWAEMENKYSSMMLPNRSFQGTHLFNRNNQPIVNLVEESKRGGFVPVTDRFWKYDKAMDDEQPCQCLNYQERDLFAEDL